MTSVDNNHIVLYHYLRALSAKVSWHTISRVLDTPVSESMRGISDALDALHIQNEVYQLPPSAEYFSQIDAPFITMLDVNRNPFCVVTKKSDSIVEISNIEGKRQRVKADDFLRRWTGNVLLGETTTDTSSESFTFWKDIWYYLLKNKIIIAILLVIMLGFLNVWQHEYSSIFMVYLGTLSMGILISVAILYKEQVNENFMERFCHIGKIVDCNHVLQSKGAKIAGISLGEASLLYFSVLFLYGVIRQTEFYGISAIACAIAICFTVYSLIYQSFILRKGCMLCMLVNLTIWCSAIVLYLLRNEFTVGNIPLSVGTFIAIGSICAAIGMAYRQYQNTYKENHIAKGQLATLLQPMVFQKLLELEPAINEGLSYKDIAINNLQSGNNQLLIITNPTCRNCAKIHSYIKQLSTYLPTSLILIFTEKVGKKITETILAAYLQEGWDKAMSLLDEWFEKQDIKEKDKYKATVEIEDMEKKLLMYCFKQNLNQTPYVIINGHRVPEVYSLQDLRYVLT